MFKFIKDIITHPFSYAVHPGLDEHQKLAIVVAGLNCLSTWFIVFINLIYYYFYGAYTFLSIQSIGLALITFGIYLFKNGSYDAGRVLIHLTAVCQVFLAVDTLGLGHADDYYYFPLMATPYILFSSKELLKPIMLSLIAGVALLSHRLIGTGYILEGIYVPESHKLWTVIIVLADLLFIFTISRYKMGETHNILKKQKEEFVYSSNALALGELSGGIAHEINNPLQIIKTNLESLGRQFASSGPINVERANSQLEKVDKTIERMVKLVKSLRLLSENGKPAKREVYPVLEVLWDVERMYEEKIKRLGIIFKWDISEAQGTLVQIDRIQLSQVLINLLNNSMDSLVQYQERWILLEAKQKDDFVIISVTDSGKKISEEVVERMMQPFYTTKEPGKGTGLGLSISLSIISKNGGNLFYDDSSPHPRFVMELPIRGKE